MALVNTFRCKNRLEDGLPDKDEDIHWTLYHICSDLNVNLKGLNQEEIDNILKDSKLARMNTRYVRNIFGNDAQIHPLCPRCGIVEPLHQTDYLNDYSRFLISPKE